jgi:hypothetical protein
VATFAVFIENGLNHFRIELCIFPIFFGQLGSQFGLNRYSKKCLKIGREHLHKVVFPMRQISSQVAGDAQNNSQNKR